MVQNSAGARQGTTPTQLTLSSKGSASCVVAAGPAPSALPPACKDLLYDEVKNPFNPFHPARSAMFFVCPDGHLKPKV